MLRLLLVALLSFALTSLDRNAVVIANALDQYEYESAEDMSQNLATASNIFHR